MEAVSLVKEGHFGVAVVAFLKKEAGLIQSVAIAVVASVAMLLTRGSVSGARGSLAEISKVSFIVTGRDLAISLPSASTLYSAELSTAPAMLAKSSPPMTEWKYLTVEERAKIDGLCGGDWGRRRED